jgi:uncharacterized protein YecT (DUF1311 family)
MMWKLNDRITQGFAVVTIGLLWSVGARAEDPAFQAQLVERGKELTQAYQNCLRAFPDNTKEQLRIAQRAWIVFDNKNEAAFAAVGQPRGMTEEELDRAGLPETVARAEMLRTYFTGPNEDVAAFRRDLDQAEQELTAAYKESLATLNRDQEQKLREAERAWIDYRDKDVRVHNGDPSGRAGLWTSLRIARRRTTQMREFYLERVASLPAEAVTSPPPVLPTPVPTPPKLDPAVRSKLIGDFQTSVKMVLAQTTASGVLTEAKTLDQVKDIPLSVADTATKLGDRAADLRQKLATDDHREDCRADLDTADALVYLEKTISNIKAGDTPAARAELSLFHEGSPTPATEAQGPLWKYLESLRALCEALESQAKTHIDRAKSDAAAGQNGEAIKEYQQAYKIFPDPNTAETIKHLREDSLGL